MRDAGEPGAPGRPAAGPASGEPTVPEPTAEPADGERAVPEPAVTEPAVPEPAGGEGAAVAGHDRAPPAGPGPAGGEPAAPGPAAAPGTRRRRLRLPAVTGTVRFRITALALLAVLAVLVVTSMALVVLQRRLLTRGLDDGLRQRADDIAALVATGRLPATLGSLGDDMITQVTTPDGRVVAAGAALRGDPPVAAPPGDGDVIRTIRGLPVDPDPYRVLSRRVDGPDGAVIVHVGVGADDITESTAALAGSLAVAVPAVAAVLAGVVWWLIGRTLRPVEAIRAEVADIDGTDVHRRVPQPGGRDEVARLARTMNGMLDRVEHATRRQQRFVADASHELRSPLTRIRTELEVDLAHPHRADPMATHRSVLEETTGLQHMVEDLLHLARSDAGATEGERAGRHRRLDLDDLVLADAQRLRSAGTVVDTSGVSAARTVGDPAQLARAIRNLTDNAARHAASTVALRLTEGDHTVVLEVADDGSGIPPAERQRVFERFTRLDDARTAASGGAGLGLAITRDIVEHHGGTIVIAGPSGAAARGTRVLVTLPRSP